MQQTLRFGTAKELFEAFPAAREDISAAPSDLPPLEFLNELLASATPENAVTFCAYLLRRREAVWWAHQCLHAVPDALGPEDQEMLLLAENWVREPEEEQRNAALAAGMGAEAKTPGVMVALGAGWSGGSMTPPDAAPVPPPPFLTAKAVNAAVLGVLARIARPDRASTLRTFVDMGVQLAERE